MEHDLTSKIKIVQALDSAAASGTTPEVGDIIDTKGYESLTYVVQTGAVTDAGTAAGIVASFTEDDAAGMGSATTVPAAQVLGSISILLDTDDDKVFRVGIIGKKRYQKITLTGTTGTDAVVSAIAILGNPYSMPVDEQNS